jgi:hypothetical protein
MSRASNRQGASVLVLVVISLVILMTLGLGLLAVSYGVRYQAIAARNESVAMLAAEAGYEQAVFRMSQQPDMLTALSNKKFSTTGTIFFDNSSCEYEISFDRFIGSRPIYRIESKGVCGLFSRVVDVYVIQAVGGWDMGMCRVPGSSVSTEPVHYANGEVIDIPIHINDLKDSPDEKDIYITGSPDFLDIVEMGESRYAGGTDKYNSVMDLFEGGIYFDQPDNKVTDETSVAEKVERFESSTKTEFQFKPQARAASLPNAMPAVQLEFFVEGGVGKVRITNDCTVRGFQQSQDDRTWDYRVKSGTNGTQYEKYPIYAYHVISEDAETKGERKIVNIEDTYVSQDFDGVKSAPGGQIFVKGNVVIGGDLDIQNGGQLLKGKMTVVATGNIWIADSVMVDGNRDLDGMPCNSNPNIFGLVSQGVIRVVDPGMSESTGIGGQPDVPNAYVYAPIGITDNGYDSTSYHRHLPATMVIESALTIGGGGFGAENVRRGSYGDRKESSGSSQDKLLVRGTLSEVLRGVVGQVGADGYLKHYYLDSRLLEGILPSDFWLRGKYIPAPAGWHDYRL